MIGLVDYGAGNLRSVQAALGRAGAAWRTVTRPDDLAGIDRLVLPGVGRFAAAAARLRATRLDEALRSWAVSGRPLLGICLGLQLLFETSEEDPGSFGLGILPGVVERLATERVPHIGWARVVPIPQSVDVAAPVAPFDAYFAHSFAVPARSPYAIARADWPVPFAAAVARAPVTGVQFHPEKSGPFGQSLLAAFAAGRPMETPPGPAQTRATGRMRRIIACLDVRGGRVVKGVRFGGLRDMGDPVERAEVYDRDGADEICLLDISASAEERRPLLGLVSAVAGRLTVPLSVGGGVRDLDEMRRLLLAGADRVSIGSAAVAEPALIDRAARAFGSQFVIVSIDARRTPAGWEVTTHGGRRATGRDAVAWAREAADRGAGEILLNAMDADGTRAGYDIALTRRVAEAVRVPVIASGGAGGAPDMARVLAEGGADAALAASIFHDGSACVRDVKRILGEAGVAVRP